MKILSLITIITLALIMVVSCSTPEKTQKALENSESLDYCVAKVKESIKNQKEFDKYPRNIEKGETEWGTTNVRNWTSGFWPGILWYAYEYSKDETIKQYAEKFTAPIKILSETPAGNHDIGFMVNCSFGNGYRLTGSEDYKKTLLDAADTLATLFNPEVGSILSWPNKLKEFRHNTIIDNMMNLELLYWASKNGGSKNLYNIAVSHAEVTMKYIVREDNSTFHVASFDENTGEFIKAFTHQGNADNSMWARGQAWGIYGFAISARETGRKDFLETSINLANHFIERLPADGIPYWDFDAPGIPNASKDASAAAIAACGMLELYDLVEDVEIKKHFKDSATKLVEILSTKKYLSEDDNQAFLNHSTGHHPKNSEIDLPIVYADYYYLEALLRLEKSKIDRG